MPCSTRLQGRKGHKEISSWSSPRAPATAGFEQCTPRLLSRSKSSPNGPSPGLRPGEAGNECGFKVSLKRLGANEFFQGLALRFDVRLIAASTRVFVTRRSKKMQLYDGVTFAPKSTLHNADYAGVLGFSRKWDFADYGRAW